MIFTETDIPGVFVIEIERKVDQRGFFGRAWSMEEFEEHGLTANFVQANVGGNTTKGTLRGLHYQIAPYQEVKLVRCTRGAVYDVALDLRAGSRTFGRWTGVELTAQNYLMLYVPEGCAHGYQTLTSDAEVWYQVSCAYAPQAERGVRYDDPAFGIRWPMEPSVVSEKDKTWPNYRDAFSSLAERESASGKR